MSFQGSNLSDNLFLFENLKIFIDTKMTDEHINSVRSIYERYIPRLTSPLNRTVVHFESRTVVQLEIKLNLCDISVPPNQDLFKTVMIRQIINFMIMSIKTIASPKLANEIGFKMSFYVPNGSPASNIQWWNDTGLTKLDWIRTDNVDNQTILGIPLYGSHCKYTLTIHFDNNYNLINNNNKFSNQLNNNDIGFNFNTQQNNNRQNNNRQNNNNDTGFNFGTQQNSNNDIGFNFGTQQHNNRENSNNDIGFKFDTPNQQNNQRSISLSDSTGFETISFGNNKTNSFDNIYGTNKTNSFDNIYGTNSNTSGFGTNNNTSGFGTNNTTAQKGNMWTF